MAVLPFAYPAVIPTVLLGVVMVYWLCVLLGAADLNLLGEGAEGVAKGALEGVTKGALEGAAKGVLEGATKGAAEFLANAASDGLVPSTEGAPPPNGSPSTNAASTTADATALLAFVRLRRVPATVALSLMTVFTWLFAVMGAWAVSVTPLLQALPVALTGTVVLGASFLLAAFPASFCAVPLGPLFRVRPARKRQDLVGRVCVVTTGVVTETFGQAELDERGAPYVLHVRCDAPGGLKKGDSALVVSFDEQRDAFVVEPYGALLARDGLGGRGLEGGADGGTAGGPDGRS
jgi:hypothetical protein